MAISLVGEYKGYTIECSDFSNGFEIRLEGQSVGKAYRTIQACEEWIDVKLKQKFKRIPALVQRGWQEKGFESVMATSIVDETYAWAITEAGRRKLALSSLLVNTPDNLEIVAQMGANEDEISRLKKENADLFAKAQKVTLALMTEGLEDGDGKG